MKLSSFPPLSKWPFIAGDLIIIAIAVLIAVYAPKPYNAITASSIILCGILGILIFFLPFVIEYFSQLWVAKNSYEGTIEKQFDSLLKVVDEIDEVARVLSGLAKNLDRNGERLANLDTEFDERFSQIGSTVEEALEARNEEIHRTIKELYGNQEKELNEISAGLSEVRDQIRESIAAQGAEEQSPVVEMELSGELPVVEEAAVAEDSPEEINPEREFEEEGIFQFETEPDSRAPFKRPASSPVSLSLVAVVNVGIGNTPYVRGDGPGLSWTEGVPMRFLEIGKWEWTIENADEPAVIQIFKNDEISAFGEEVCVGVGERVEIHPKFPS